MAIEANSAVEQRAKKAENLPAFSGINLLGIKAQVSEMLRLIGMTGFFATYTRHDISHIDAMLEILEWLVPQETSERMTPADWMTIVLAVYFHDLGMVVSEAEYAQRAESKFPSFASDLLESGPNSEDYKARVQALPATERERFLYQEFVRHHHAIRVRRWIEGEAAREFGVSVEVEVILKEMLKALPAQYRNDLALICQSHHSNDLDDVEKYKTNKRYGKRRAETVNLQYVAVLLRSDGVPRLRSRGTSPMQ